MATEIISEQRKIPKEIKDKLNETTFINFTISIALMIYMIVINLLYLNEDVKFFSASIKTLSMVLIIIDIIIFEIGFRKDSIKIWIHAIELLVCSILVLSIQYVYLYSNEITKKIFMLLPLFCSIYYVAKTIIIHIIETKKYQNNLSDVKEIIKEEEEGYLDDIKEPSLVQEVNNIEEIKRQEKEFIKRDKKEKKNVGKND